MKKNNRVAHTSVPEERVDSFQDRPFSRWSGVSGSWTVEDDVEITDVDRKELYRSPEEPSSARWPGVWREADGSIKVRFAQITGNPGLEPSYKPAYGRQWRGTPGVSSWPEFCKRRGMAEGPEDAIETTRVDHIIMASRDGGETWEDPCLRGPGEDPFGYSRKPALMPDGSLLDGGVSTIVCRDGRVVQTIEVVERMEASERLKSEYLLGIRESLDGGKTWSETQYIIPDWEKDDINEWTEENALVELDDGRILVLIRTARMDVGVAQIYLTRTGFGEYVATPTIRTIMPHSGYPDTIRCSNGTIWYWGHDGHYYTTDEGRTWRPLPKPRFSCYYGKMIEAAPNRVLSVTQRDTGDSPYPHSRDAYIERMMFSHRRVGVMKQTDASPSLALIRMDESRYEGDLHIRVDLRLDKADGLAFRISPDGKSFYAFTAIMPDTEAYKRWAFPEMQEEALSAWHPGLLAALFPDEGVLPIAVLARVDRGKINVLRGVGFENAKGGEWMQLQVKVQGDLIQAALFGGDSVPPTYLGVRDSTYKDGGIGFMTDDGSLGEFKNLHVWSSPQMIRDLWSLQQ